MFRQGSSAGDEKFSVRGDGLTTATTAEAGVSAVVVHATHVAYTGDVLVAQTTLASDDGFHLFKVRGGACACACVVCAWERAVAGGQIKCRLSKYGSLVAVV